MQYHDRRENSASVPSLSKTFACGALSTDPEHFGCGERSSFEPSAFGINAPAPAHVVVGLCSPTPRGQECWGGISPSPSCVPHPCRCCRGNSPPSPSRRVARHGAPRKELCRITRGSHNMPGPFAGLSLPLRENS